jgi:septal ring factor EnvC (AmiA/AmiB activator)
MIWASGQNAVWAETGQRTATDRPAGKIDKPQKNLERVNRQLQQMQKRQKEAVRKEQSLLKQLEASDRQLQTKRRELVLIEAKIKQRDIEIQDLRLQRDGVGEALEAQRSLVGERLVTIYKEGKTPYLRILIDSQDYHEFSKRYVYLQRVVQKETQLLTDYEKGVKTLEDRSVRLEGMKDSLLEDRSELQAKLGEIGVEKRKKDRLLARIQDEKTTYQQAIEELEESSQKLQALIKGLEKKRRLAKLRGGQARQEPGSLGISQNRGRLNWPVDGKLVTRFGLQKHPKFDTYVYRKGIEIGSFQGGIIRSIYDGHVVYADWFPGYGMVIILDHGENYYSLYAHLAKLLVSVGDPIKKDQIIGEIGDTGVSEGERLYFEFREGEKPIDPLTWLKAKP